MSEQQKLVKAWQRGYCKEVVADLEAERDHYKALAERLRGELEAILPDLERCWPRNGPGAYERMCAIRAALAATPEVT